MTINDQSDDTQTKILEECGLTLEQYGSALGCVLKKYSVLYKWKPGEVNIRPYNTVILKLLKSKMNHNLSKINIYIWNAYVPNIVFIQAWTYNNWTYGKGIKGGLS